MRTFGRSPRRIYNHSEYWPERVEAQRLWGDTLAAMRREIKRSRREAG